LEQLTDVRFAAQAGRRTTSEKCKQRHCGAVQNGGYSVLLPTGGKARGLDALDVFETDRQGRAALTELATDGDVE
jgi:hypothetical protein